MFTLVVVQICSNLVVIRVKKTLLLLIKNYRHPTVHFRPPEVGSILHTCHGITSSSIIVPKI